MSSPRDATCERREIQKRKKRKRKKAQKKGAKNKRVVSTSYLGRFQHPIRDVSREFSNALESTCPFGFPEHARSFPRPDTSLPTPLTQNPLRRILEKLGLRASVATSTPPLWDFLKASSTAARSCASLSPCNAPIMRPAARKHVQKTQALAHTRARVSGPTRVYCDSLPPKRTHVPRTRES